MERLYNGRLKHQLLYEALSCVIGEVFTSGLLLFDWTNDPNMRGILRQYVSPRII